MPAPNVGARNYWCRAPWVILIILMVVLARSVASAADIWENANALLSKGRAREAAQVFETLVRQHPKDARAYMGRGRARWRLNEIDGCIADFTKVIELAPKDSSAYNNRGLAYDLQGKKDLALADYAKAIEINPKSATERYNRGLTWSSMREYEKALVEFTAAAELDRKLSDAHGFRAAMLNSLGEYEKAVEAADKALSIDPKHRFAWSTRALSWCSMNEPEKARQDFERAVEVTPNDAKAHNFLGFFLMSRGENARALESFNKAVELDPKGTVQLNSRGQALTNLRQFAKALTDFDKAIALSPKHAKTFRNRAGCFLAMGDYPKAIADSTKCIDLTPEESHAWRTRAEAETALGDEAAAARDMEQAIILGPQPVSGLAAWVPAAIKRRDDLALKAVIADASPENRVKLATARHDHAFAILDSEHREPDQPALEEAVALARSACVLDPANAAHAFLTGLLYRELSAFDERARPMAEKMLTKATELDETHAAAWLELGLMMITQERPMEAIAALERALENDPIASAEHALGPLCAVYAANDEGFRGLDFFDEQYAANPEVPAFAVGRALMLDCLGDRPAALSQMQDLVLIEEAGSPERAFAEKLIAEWKGAQP
jgi:tetratricopeptide (TPR) repeat protein